MPPLPPLSKPYEDEEEVFQRSQIPSRVAQPPLSPEDHLRAIIRLSPPTEKTKPKLSKQLVMEELMSNGYERIPEIWDDELVESKVHDSKQGKVKTVYKEEEEGQGQ